ncbi:MAG: Flp pilus assembly protein CpaB [Candidatus Binataceae bacterium]
MIKRPVVFLGLSALAAVIAAIIVFSALRGREAQVQRALAKSVEIVVASRNLPLGTRIAPIDLKLTRWARDSLPAGAYTNTQSTVGAFVKNQFLQNEPIVASKLYTGDKSAGVMPLLIPDGMRAMAVPVDEVSVIAGFVKPKTHVDVLAAISGNSVEQPSFSKVVVQDVEVLAVAQDIDEGKDEPKVVKVVTLLVTPAQAEKLTLASREGTLRLAMRSYGDQRIVATPGAGIKELLRGDSRAPVLQSQQVVAAPEAAVAAIATAPLRRPGPRPVVIDIMRDGAPSETISFVNSAIVGHSTPKTGRARRGIGPQPASSPAAPPPDASPPVAGFDSSASNAYAPFEKSIDVPSTNGGTR